MERESRFHTEQCKQLKNCPIYVRCTLSWDSAGDCERHSKPNHTANGTVLFGSTSLK